MVSLKNIRLKSGEVLGAVSIDENDCIIPGFVACKKYNSVIYIAVSEIASFTVEITEKSNVGGLAPLINVLVPLLDTQKGN